ncbi:MAG: tetratricopeptide repeat protein [Isosphaeraceae bacterium]
MVGTRFVDRPELEEYLRWIIAGVYHSLASWDKAEAQTRSLMSTAQKRDPDSAEFYKYQGFLTHLLWHSGKLDGEALGKGEEAVKALERLLGPEDETTQGAMNELAMAYDDVGRGVEAIALWERVRDVASRNLGADHANTLTVLANLAAGYQKANRPDLAVPLFEDVVRRQEATLGREHQNTQMTRSNLGYIYFMMNRPKDAVPLLELVYQGSKRYPEFRGNTPVLIDAYRRSGQPEKALPLLEEKVAETTAERGPDHPETLSYLQVLATACREAGKLDRAIPLYEDVLKRREAKFGRNDRATQTTAANLGSAYIAAGRPRDGIPLLEEARESAKQYTELAWVNGDLLGAYEKAGETAKFADLLQQGLAGAREKLPPDSPQLAGMLAQVSTGLVLQKKWTEAEPLLRECLAIREKREPDDWRTFNTRSMLGGALLGREKYAEAEPLLLAGYEGMKSREAMIPEAAKVRLSEAIDRLVGLYTAMGKDDEVRRWQSERSNYPEAGPMPAEKK